MKNKEHLWTFLKHKILPSGNNSAERAIRNGKVKQKVSGQFRCYQGAVNFAIIKLIIDTVIKNGNPIFDALLQIPKFVPD